MSVLNTKRKHKKRTWLGVVSLCSISFMATAASTDSVDRSFSYDSSVTISGVSPKDTRWITVEIASEERKTKTLQRAYWPANSPLPAIYLNQGAGKYTINVYASGGSLSTEAKYKPVASMRVENKDLRNLKYLLPSLDIQSDSPEIKQLALQITHGITNDLDKALAIHDWLTANIAYDQEGVDNNTYAGTPNDALSVSRSKLAVCEGFANLAAALHRALGIRARVAVGKLIGSLDTGKTNEAICEAPTSSHAWVEVYVDNRWVSIDASLDDGRLNGDTGKYVRTPKARDYFDPNPALLSLTHLKCNEDVDATSAASGAAAAAAIAPIGTGAPQVLVP